MVFNRNRSQVFTSKFGPSAMSSSHFPIIQFINLIFSVSDIRVSANVDFREFFIYDEYEQRVPNSQIPAER